MPPEAHQLIFYQNATAGRGLPARAAINLNPGGGEQRGNSDGLARCWPLLANAQNGFHVAVGVNFRYPTLAPSRSPTPVRIGTTTILLNVRAVMPNPPTK